MMSAGMIATQAHQHRPTTGTTMRCTFVQAIALVLRTDHLCHLCPMPCDCFPVTKRIAGKQVDIDAQ